MKTSIVAGFFMPKLCWDIANAINNNSFLGKHYETNIHVEF